ncbi:MAG: class II aldolase/adducin family protein [Candidatus Bathyarchaeota archaeon]|nr:class II aldolase/adducin family protein [Candidatus Bathyarchaeota archaeon]
MSEFLPLSSEEELKGEICETMRRLFNRGLISALGGNVSARIPGAKEFWITPSGVFKGELKPEDLLKADLDGRVIEGFLRPSVETPFHAMIYRKRADVNAVVHCHNPFATGLALAGIPIQPITVEAAVVLRKVRVVPWAFPGTDALANLVGEYIEGARALILMNHGVIGVGSNLLEAEAIVETLEEVAMTQFVASVLKREIPLIPREDMELIEKLYKV